MKQKKFIRCAPHLPVKNLRHTLDYYREVLGFDEEWMMANIDGGIQRDGMRLLFVEDEDFTTDINNQKHSLPLLWFVEDIDAIFEEFKERKIPLAADLQTHSYGLREFAFVDINGYYIRIAETIYEGMNSSSL